MSQANTAKSDLPASGVEMIHVPNTLKAKVGARFGGIDAGALAKAEAALKGLSSQFSVWLQDEINKLEAARANITAKGMTAETAEVLYVHAHDLKGLGGTYEFPLVTRIAGSLCHMMDEQSARASAPMFLVDAHLSAIKAAVRDNIRDTNHPIGKALTAELESRVSDYLKERGL